MAAQKCNNMSSKPYDSAKRIEQCLHFAQIPQRLKLFVLQFKVKPACLRHLFDMGFKKRLITLPCDGYINQ